MVKVMESVIKSYSVNLPKDLLNKLKIKCHSEGFTVQETINILVTKYVEEGN